MLFNLATLLAVFSSISK